MDATFVLMGRREPPDQLAVVDREQVCGRPTADRFVDARLRRQDHSAQRPVDVMLRGEEGVFDPE